MPGKEIAVTRSGRKRVVVVGAGFGGLEFCKRFRSNRAEIILIDRRNHHLFQPLLYQMATAGLSAPEISQPIRSIFCDRPDITVLMEEVTGIDPKLRTIQLSSGPVEYDYLVIALGARANYFGNDGWQDFAPSLKTLEDAAAIRRSVLSALEHAETTEDPVLRRKLMTIAVIGGGPTGVELAGAFAELTRHVLPGDFRRITPAECRIVLIEAMDRILPMFSSDLGEKAVDQLNALGVEVRIGSKVTEIRRGEVYLDGETIHAENIIWTAGVAANPLTGQLGAELDRNGRVKVRPDLSLPDHREIFAIGDLVHLVDPRGVAVPGVAPAAMQMGRHVADMLTDEIERDISPDSDRHRTPFTYFDKGSMATIGRSAAIAEVGPIKIHGLLAWLAWLFVHLVSMVGMKNKIVVFIQWIYSYVTYRRGARIIWGETKP